jgi:excisionase family DNA binding protein
MYNSDRTILLTIRDTCELLGIGRSTLYRLIDRGEIPVIHIGRAVRLRRSDVDAWIDQL